MDKLLVEQYYQEIKNSLFYSRLATHCSSWNLMGFSNFFKNQSKEEYLHSVKLLNHLLERKIVLTGGSLLQEKEKESVFPEDDDIKDFVKFILDESLKKEKENSKNFDKIMKFVEVNKKYGHQDIIMWFINEQVEEENVFKVLIQKFKISNENVYLLDKELLHFN